MTFPSWVYQIYTHMIFIIPWDYEYHFRVYLIHHSGSCSIYYITTNDKLCLKAQKYRNKCERLERTINTLEVKKRRKLTV